MEDDVMTLPEAAKYLKISEEKLYQMVAEGSIPHRRLGRLIRFTRSGLLAHLNAGDAR